MADPVLYSAASRAWAALLTFAWGDPAWPAYALGNEPEGGVQRYTTWSEPITIGDDTWLPVKALAFTLADADGGTADEELTITMPGDLEPAAAVMRGGWVIVRVVLEQCDPTSAAATREVIRRRWAKSRLRNGSAGDGVAKIPCAGSKSFLQDPLGMEAMPSCFRTVYSAGCGAVRADYTFEATITAADGHSLTADLFGTIPTVSGRSLGAGWLRDGKAIRGGMRLGVRDHDGDTIQLYNEAPPWWVGETITVEVGCDNSIGMCRGRFDREESFLGVGIAIPDHSVILNDGR